MSRGDDKGGRWTRAAAWLFAFTFVPASAQSRAQGAGLGRAELLGANEPATPWRARVAAVLRDAEGDPHSTPERVGLQLVVLGAGALPTVAELLGSGWLSPSDAADPATSRRLTKEELDALRAGVTGFGRQTSLPLVQALDNEFSGTETRAGALEILASVGRASDLQLAIAVATPSDGSTGEAQRLLRGLERTVEAITRRDPGVHREMTDLLRTAPYPVASALVRGVVAAGDHAALPALAADLDHESELAVLVLSELGRAARNAPRPLDGRLLHKVRSYLDSEDVLQVRAAAGAAAALGDFGSVDALIGLLSSPSPLLQEAGLLALRSLSGLVYGSDPQLWTAWHERERGWFEAHSVELFEDLGSPYASRVTGALCALAGHRYKRDEIAASVASALRHPNPDVRRLACSTLASLGSRPSARELVPCLEDPDPGMARAAWRALRTISGKDLPLDRAAWESGL